jgi:hypothetical protein
MSANHVARWTASTNRWSAVGSGENSAGARHCRWNIITGAWSNLGGGMVHAGPVPAVRALAIDGGNVCAGGSESQNVAKWNGSHWVTAGGLGTTGDGVDALAISAVQRRTSARSSK